MKKKIIFAAVAAVMGVSAYVGVNARQKDAMSDIQMTNVEALVQYEIDKPKYKCAKNIEYVQGSNLIRHCKTCSFKYGYTGEQNDEC